LLRCLKARIDSPVHTLPKKSESASTDNLAEWTRIT
jgi:hypothetical protein